MQYANIETFYVTDN